MQFIIIFLHTPSMEAMDLLNKEIDLSLFLSLSHKHTISSDGEHKKKFKPFAFDGL